MRVNSTGFMAVVHRVGAFLRLFERFQKYLEMNALDLHHRKLTKS